MYKVRVLTLKKYAIGLLMLVITPANAGIRVMG